MNELCLYRTLQNREVNEVFHRHLTKLTNRASLLISLSVRILFINAVP